MLKIRVMGVRDLKSILAIWKKLPGIGLNESDTLPNLKNYLTRNPGLSLVAVDGKKVVGGVLCGHDGRRGYLNHLSVLPGYQHRGLGQAMAERCYKKLKSLGIPYATIFVYRNNRSGLRFWVKTGWQVRHDLSTLRKKL